ncbi:hypothetical protein EON83_18230 [bacterium]|nr:MAG: hypothetical protein EON83_18230 [bacterium]
MPVVIHLDAIHEEVRKNWGAEKSYQLQAATLGESMSQLVLKHPQLAFLLDTEGNVRRFINFTVNDAHYSQDEIDSL